MDLKERLERSDTFLNEITEKLKPSTKQEAKAHINDGCCEISVEPNFASAAEVDYLNERINWIRDDLNYFRERFYAHMEGHLPKIIGATAMQKALKGIGMDGDFEVQKQVIYANDGKATSEQFLITRLLQTTISGKDFVKLVK